MAKQTKDEELMNAYVSSVENDGENHNIAEATVEPIPIFNEQKTMADIARENRTHGNPDVPVDTNNGVHYKDNIGWLKLNIEDFPTHGQFYPEGFSVSIRSARGEEIKHWSTMNEQDIQQLAKTDDILNYMIEKCVNVKNPMAPGNCWKDLKNVDRMYVLMAIQEFTFIKGENELMVPVSEGKEIPLSKEMISFINIPEKLWKFYDGDNKCFTFHVDGQDIHVYIPSIGVNAWLKEYVIRKTNAREGYDQDFIQFAPMLIRDYRTLNVSSYEKLVSSTTLWGHKEWSVISYVTGLLSDASEPKIKLEEDGTEIPLNFRGGMRSLFLVSDPLLDLC